MKNKVVMMVVGTIVIAGVSFYGGMQYGRGSARQTGQSPFGSGSPQVGNGGAGRRAGGALSGGFAGGEIIAKDGESITVKMQAGGSKIVFFSDTTKVTKSAEGSPGDLTVGEQVTVTGTANTDGSITAQTIQLRPEAPATR